MAFSAATTYDAAAAREQLPALLHRAASGEEIVIAESGTPLARLVALPPAEAVPPKRVGGQLAGQGFWIADDFDAPLPPDLLHAFEGGDQAPSDAG